jgi:hypothetical protein
MNQDNNNNNILHLVIHQHQHPHGVIIFNKLHQHSFGIINILHHQINLHQQQLILNQCMYQLFFRISNFFFFDIYRTVPSGKANETTKNEREAKRTQDALSKWTQAQFKDDSQDIDGKIFKFY